MPSSFSDPADPTDPRFDEPGSGMSAKAKGQPAEPTPRWVLLLGGIGAAVIIAGGTIVGALIGRHDSGAGPSPALGPSPAAAGSPAPASGSRTSEKHSHYRASIKESDIEGEVVWADDGPRLTGVLQVRGGRSACSVKLSFEARTSTGSSVAGDERRCDNTRGWPGYEWSVPPEQRRETERIDILARLGDEVVTRVTCTRSGECDAR
jgi:hypothetical protein